MFERKINNMSKTLTQEFQKEWQGIEGKKLKGPWPADGGQGWGHYDHNEIYLSPHCYAAPAKQPWQGTSARAISFLLFHSATGIWSQSPWYQWVFYYRKVKSISDLETVRRHLLYMQLTWVFNLNFLNTTKSDLWAQNLSKPWAMPDVAQRVRVCSPCGSTGFSPCTVHGPQALLVGHLPPAQ